MTEKDIARLREIAAIGLFFQTGSFSTMSFCG